MSKERNREEQDQSQRFIEAARELGCDESEERFDETLKRVAKHRPAANSVANPSPTKSDEATAQSVKPISSGENSN